MEKPLKMVIPCSQWGIRCSVGSLNRYLLANNPFSPYEKWRCVMKKTIILSIVIALFVTLAPVVSAEMPKEGSTAGKTCWITKYNMLPMGNERVQINYEGWGVSVSDTGEGLLHNASGHVVGGLLSVKGVYENDSGLACFTLPDGDQIFLTYKTSGAAGKTGKGAFIYVGGTGKFVGLQGRGEFTRHMLRPPAEGFGASISVSKSQWKIVEVKK
jgi:hypothetical protein